MRDSASAPISNNRHQSKSGSFVAECWHRAGADATPNDVLVHIHESALAQLAAIGREVAERIIFLGEDRLPGRSTSIQSITIANEITKDLKG